MTEEASILTPAEYASTGGSVITGFGAEHLLYVEQALRWCGQRIAADLLELEAALRAC